jgi:hypothetical protein
MRALLTASLAAATIGLFTASLPAMPASVAVKQNATPLVQLAQYGGGYGYHHRYCHRYRVCSGYGYYRHCHWVCR